MVPALPQSPSPAPCHCLLAASRILPSHIAPAHPPACPRACVLAPREQLFVDAPHPGESGHKVMADLAVYFVQQVALDILVDPVTHAQVEETKLAAIPRPVFEGARAHQHTKGGLGACVYVVDRGGYPGRSAADHHCSVCLGC